MELPFTSEQFFDVFGRYNTDFPFAERLLTVIAIAAVAFLFVKTPLATRAIYLSLGLLWAWTGIVYHILYFSTINPAAFLFGAMTVVQAVLFVSSSFFSNEELFGFRRDTRGYFGAILIVFALVLYPLIGGLQGHDFPRSPTFGLPCPLTVFTLGVLLCSKRTPPWYLLTVPTLWAVIGSSAAVLFGIWQDLSLLAASAISIAFAVNDRRRT